MKAVLGDLPATDDGWAYEIKWDGMRAMTYVNDPAGPALRLESTRGADATERFPELTDLPAALAPHAAILDGELVAFDDRGRPSFGRIQPRIHIGSAQVAARRAAADPVQYHVFDVLHLDGRDLTTVPYLERRAMLAELVADATTWRVPRHYVGGGAELLEAARANGLEGVMAKRTGSRYLPGKRSPAWVKVKVRSRQELVIGGWQPGQGNRSGRLGSLLLGYHAPESGGALRYAGKVGTGFSAAELARLAGLLAPLAIDAPPFDPPPPNPVARVARWVRPELVAEITFAEWTTDGTLRHPSYEGLRDDKDPADVVREG